MRRILVVSLLVMLWARSADATVIYSQTFESFADGDGCTELTVSAFTSCEEQGAGDPANPSTITVENAVPGYAGSLPSGTKVLRSWTNAITAQSDAAVAIGDAGNAAFDNYIPADSWWQVAMYVNNSGAEVPANLKDRPMKLFYPCAGNYPCGSDSAGHKNYFLIETARHTSYEPFNDTSLNTDTTGEMWLVSRDNTEGTPNYTGAGAGDENKLGQTSLAESIKPNRWNIIRCHANFSNTAAASIECWIGAKGSALTKVMSWVGGVAVEGNAFSWTVPAAQGHRAMLVPSTQPANNTFPQELYTYYDDFYVATSESDLPTYTATTSVGGSGTITFSGTVSIQ